MIRTLSFSLAVVLSLASIAPTFAEAPKDGPGVIFSDPFVENLSGNWDVTRTIRGKTEKNRVEAHLVVNHQYLELQMSDVATPPVYAAIVLIGYDHEAQEYVAHWCDSFGARYSGVGRGKLVGTSISFTFNYPDGPFVNTFTWNANDGTWTSRMENVAPDGTHRFFAEDVYRRR